VALGLAAVVGAVAVGPGAGRAVAQVTATVQAAGLAAVHGDLAGAYTQAERAALREAVEQAVGTLVSGQTRVSHLAVVEDEILTRTAGFVERYQVVDRRRLDAHTVQVTVDAVVRLGALEQSLAALDLLVDAVGNPRLLCLGRLVTAGRPPAEGGVATALRRALSRASSRFTLVAPVASAASSAAWTDVGAAAALGRQQGAEVVIRAEAAVQAAPDAAVPFSGGVSLGTLGICSAQAQVQLDALWTDSGQAFASLSVTERAAAPTAAAAAEKATRLGTERAAGQLLQRLAEDWRERAYNGQWVRLVVDGPALEQDRFRSLAAQRLASLETLVPRSRSGDVAVYDARCRGTGFRLARDLAACDAGTLAIQVEEVTTNTLRLRLGP
jgi:hypothetical protein